MSEKVGIAIKMIIDRIQTRAATNPDTVAEYADAMKAGAMFPPVTVFEVSSGDYVLADGLHRLAAVERNGGKSIEAEVHPGTKADALKWALKANVTNGLRRTNDDKHRCVGLALKEFEGLSNRVVADMCGVSHVFVAAVRTGNGYQLPETTTAPGTVTASTPEKRESKNGRMHPATKAKKHDKSIVEIMCNVVDAASAFAAEPGAEVKAEPVDKYADIKAAQAQVSAGVKRGKQIRPSFGKQYAVMAITQLEKIDKRDTERKEAFAMMKQWIESNE